MRDGWRPFKDTILLWSIGLVRNTQMPMLCADVSARTLAADTASTWNPVVGREKATNRPQKVTQAAVCRRSEHHAVFVGCQHQGCPHYCLGQGTGATLTLRNAPYRLQRVWFVTSRLSIYPALLRTIDRSNAKLGEGIKRLF